MKTLFDLVKKPSRERDLRSAIKLMKSWGVRFKPGMSDAHLAHMEEATGVQLPEDFKEFLRIAVPVNGGFYNWRDNTPENIEHIKEAVIYPYLDILDEITRGDYWCDDWGVQPDDMDEAVAIYKEEYSKAPKLVPLLGNKYAIKDQDGLTRVLSIRGTDTILYGESLAEYFEAQFNHRTHIPSESFNKFAWGDLPFWGQLDNSSSYMSDD